MADKKNTTDTPKIRDYLKQLRESTAKLSEEFPDMTDRFKELLEQLESVVPELIARKATHEEIDLEVFDLLVKHVRIDPSLVQDFPPELLDLKQRYSAAALFVYAQVYYKILEVVSSGHVAYADLALNCYYLHVVKNIKHLLSLDELKDFTGDFDPPEHVLPSYDLRTIEWEDGTGPAAVDFLASVQIFLNELDSGDDEATGAIFFVKWLHKKNEPIFEKIEEYRLKTEKYFDGLMGKPKASPETKPKIQKWEELSVDFIDDETIRYKAKNGRWERANYAELGFSDRRKGLPNKLWGQFRTLAQHCNGGYVEVKTPGNIQKDIDRICQTLKDFFGPTDRPIPFIKKDKRWQVKFDLSWKRSNQN